MSEIIEHLRDEEEQRSVWWRASNIISVIIYSSQTARCASHRTLETYIRSHCTISLVIWWQRVTSTVSKRPGPGAETPGFVLAGAVRICAVAAYIDADEDDTFSDEEEDEGAVGATMDAEADEDDEDDLGFATELADDDDDDDRTGPGRAYARD